ncbi:hypothetical protein WDU94_012003 [Cyamophila willieti]
MAENGAVKRVAESAFDIDNMSKKLKTEDGAKEESQGTNLPYRNIPYHEQLDKKQAEVDTIFKAFSSSFLKHYPQFSKWYKDVFLESRFRLDTIMKSPKTMAYRNKCELTVGYNPEQGKLCAGPRISNGEDGKVQVGPCTEDLIHLPPSMIQIAQDFSNFLDKWNYLEEKCPWYNLFIRSTKSGDHMLIVIVREDSQEILKERKNELVKYYTDDYTLQHAIKSIYIQPRKEDCTKKSFELEFLHAHGEEFLVEDLLDMKLVVTPGIFFRINTYSAEVLYQKTLDAGDLKKKSTLILDLWCGCGELSILASKRSNYVIGIDPSKWNIKKAQFMARYNKVRNIEFIIAKPEDGLKQIWQRLPMAEEIVIIADPPTLCKMYSLGEMLAEMPNVKRFIYLYSSHKLHLVKNLISLTEASFLPTRVIPVDVSPHNVRLELIASLKRVDPHEKPLIGPGAVPALPPADWIEEIERRAFAMGMAKAMAAAPALPARRPIPELGPEDEYDAWGEERLGGGYGAPARPAFGAPAARGSFGGSSGRGKFGAGRDAAPASGYGGAKRKFGGGGAGYGGGYDDYEAPAGDFGGAPAGRGYGRDSGAGFGASKSGGAGYGRGRGGASGFGGGRGSGGGYGTERSKYGGYGGAESSGYGAASGYDEGYEEYGTSFGSGFAAKRGRGASSGGFSRDGFGRSGFSVDVGSDFSSGFRGGRGRPGSRGRGGRGGR